jgi:hypothetical protein
MSQSERRLYRKFLHHLGRYWDRRLILELNTGASAIDLAQKYGLQLQTLAVLERGFSEGERA